MQLRTIFTNFLNNGRSEVRSYLYLNLLFIVDRIGEFSNRNVARGAGFDVIFNPARTELELNPEGLTGIWDIPLARIGDASAQRSAESGHDHNMLILNKLQEDFPCLSLEIRYQREVKTAAGGSLDREGRRLTVEPAMWPDVDKVSLHVVAVHMLMELVSVKSIDMVLAASKLSLRTVQILAIGLRALMLRSLEMVEKQSSEFAVTDVGLTALERNIVGDVVYENISKGADLVTVKMDETKSGGKQSVRLAVNRDKKLAMTLEDYKQALADAERERARSAATATAERMQTELQPAVDAREADDDWLFGG